MGYPISTMIGIRTGGVFAGTTVMDALKEQIVDVIAKMEEDNIRKYKKHRPAYFK